MNPWLLMAGVTALQALSKQKEAKQQRELAAADALYAPYSKQKFYSGGATTYSPWADIATNAASTYGYQENQNRWADLMGKKPAKPSIYDEKMSEEDALANLGR